MVRHGSQARPLVTFQKILDPNIRCNSSRERICAERGRAIPYANQGGSGLQLETEGGAGVRGWNILEGFVPYGR